MNISQSLPVHQTYYVELSPLEQRRIWHVANLLQLSWLEVTKGPGLLESVVTNFHTTYAFWMMSIGATTTSTLVKFPHAHWYPRKYLTSGNSLKSNWTAFEPLLTFQAYRKPGEQRIIAPISDWIDMTVTIVSSSFMGKVKLPWVLSAEDIVQAWFLTKFTQMKIIYDIIQYPRCFTMIAFTPWRSSMGTH